MNKQDLTELLEDIAKSDLSDGADIFDHPCSVAVRAIDQCFSDVQVLRKVFNGAVKNKSPYSKRVQILAGLSYEPSF